MTGQSLSAGPHLVSSVSPRLLAIWPIRHIGTYAAATALVSGANFLAVPLLLALLAPDAFARWALVEPLLTALVPLVGLGMQAGMLHALSSGQASRSEVTAAILPAYALASAGGATLAGIAFLSLQLGPTMALLSAALILAESLLLFSATLWRAERRPSAYFLQEGGRAVFYLAVLVLVSIGLVFWPIQHAEDYFALRLFAALLCLLGAFAVLRPRFALDAGAALKAVRFGFPIALAAVPVAGLVNLDRYIMAALGGETALGSYVAHARVSMVVVMLLMAPFFAWFVPEAMRRTKTGETGFLVAVTTRFWISVLLVGCNVWILLPIVWPVLFPRLPFDAGTMALLLAGSTLFALGNPVSIGVLNPGYTFLSPTLALAALVLGLACASGLGMAFGEHGIMFGRLAGFAAYIAFFGCATQRILGIRYPGCLYAFMALGALLVCSAGQVGGTGPAETAAKLILLNGTVLAALLSVRLRHRKLAT